MPIFARRRLQSMLDELANYMDAGKCTDLLHRLEHKNTNSALAAEAELSMLWAISREAHLVVEPKLPASSRRPDAFSNDLFASASSVIEIRALSDDNFSGLEAMNRTANIIAGFADWLRKRAGSHLYFTFNERSYTVNNRFHRERCVSPDFELTSSVKETLRQWITSPNWPNPGRIRITEGKTDVTISWQESISPLFRVFCTMPSVAYDLEANSVYKALKDKARQIKSVDSKTLRCIFLVDAGCDLLRRLRPISTVWEIGGEEIIWHALNKLSIDIVCVFSPHREHSLVFTTDSRLSWKVTYFDKREGLPDEEYLRLKNVSARLPQPRYEGYQARNLHNQDSFNPQSRGQFLKTMVITQPQEGKMTIKISSRLIQEYLAGRLDKDQFKRWAFSNGNNLFETELDLGRTIKSVKFESSGLDEDDDHLIFDLDFDWGANSLKNPAVSGSKYQWRLLASVKKFLSRYL